MSDATRKRGVTNDQEYNTTTMNSTMEAGNAISNPSYVPGDQHFERMAAPTTSESHTRSLAKGFTWRCLATLTTVIIAWVVTGETGTAFQIGFFEFFAKLGIYYIHERAWTRIKM
jgi:uncharacterized membrane protein